MACPHKDMYVLYVESGATVEKCPDCKKKIVTKTGKDGRINNRKYLKEHAAHFAQPVGKTAKLYRQTYGEPVNKSAKIKQDMERMKERADEEYEEAVSKIRREEWSSNGNYLNGGV